jgi:[ribosomal protein S5]-alanine N-acetyltransferase
VNTGTIERVQTDRLVCEQLRAKHLPDVTRLLLDPRVGRTLWPPSEPPTERTVARGMVAKLDHWERYGFGLWLVRDRNSGDMVGRGGLQWTFIADAKEVEAGWAIVPERWGQGLGTELARACVDAAFGRLGMLQIVALALPENVGSRRVMEKAGFGYEREVVHAGLPHVLYRASSD